MTLGHAWCCRPVVPEADYKNALQQLDEAWQSALQMMRFSQNGDDPDGRRSSPPKHYVTDDSALRSEASRALFVRFRRAACREKAGWPRGRHS